MESDRLTNIESAILSIAEAIKNTKKEVMFSVQLHTTTAFATTGFAKIGYTTSNSDVEFNIGGAFDTATMRFTAPYDGYYDLRCAHQYGGAMARSISTLYKNGVEWKRGSESSNEGANTSVIAYLAKGDYIEHYHWTSATSSIEGTSPGVYFNGRLIKAV